MNTENDMILITALIRPHMEGHVVRALHDLTNFPGFTFDEVRGQGRGRGQGGSYVASDEDITYHQFLELRLSAGRTKRRRSANALQRPLGPVGKAMA
jgi:nitrogen regulatory protein P-II 1